MIVIESDKDEGLKLHDLRCFDAVARSGSFQAAARLLHRSHPSVFAAVQRLEARLGLVLLDRSGYRVALTEVGRSFHLQAAGALGEIGRLSAHARQLAAGEEPVLRITLGDLCPRPLVLGWLSTFFSQVSATRLHLDYEAVGGPLERLREGSASIVFHRAEDSAVAVERIILAEISLLPVAAPNFLPRHLDGDLRLDQLRPFTQCVIRDTAGPGASEDHFLIEGAPRCSVPDHAMKRELILHGLCWGHLPDFIVADDLVAGRLVRIGGRHLPGRTETLAALRRCDRVHGPVAQRLWDYIRTHAPVRSSSELLIDAVGSRSPAMSLARRPFGESTSFSG